MILATTLRSKCALLATVCALILGASTFAAADSIALAWDAGSGVGYKVHVGESGSYTQHFDVGSATMFTFASATAGQRYCFAVSAYLLSSLLEGPNSGEVCGYSDAPPTLTNPGTRTSTVGQAVSLQLVGSDPASQPLTYGANGLPPGLSLMVGTGFISGSGTTAGTYSVTVDVTDGVLSASETFSWVMNPATGGSTTPPPTGPDTTGPIVTISTPTSGSSFTSTSSTLVLRGSASDDNAVAAVGWMSDRGGSGYATGTTSWSTATITLRPGTNIITVGAVDAAGNQGTTVLTVTYGSTGAPPTTPVPPASTVALTAQPVFGSNWGSTRLTWSNAPWSSVDVYRNGTRIINTPNDGTHLDPIWSRGTYSYKICAAGSTTTCSNLITVYY